MLVDLDKRDTAALKGLAITAIVFHNYFHVVSPAHQNEFHFRQARFPVFLATVVDPAMSIQALFSFFGHFGVQVFIFLSAFGLAKSYWNGPCDWAIFMWSRVRKLYPMFVAAILCWFVLASMQIGPDLVIRQKGLELLAMMVGLSNILPGYHLPPVGPWWFIPFIVQFYALWPFLRKLTIKFGWRGLLVLSTLCLAVTYAADPILDRWSVNLLETPIGRMPGICLGIVAARYSIRIDAFLALSAFAVLLLGSAYAVFFPFTFLAALVMALWMYLKMRGTLKSSRLLERLGYYSLAIFLFNGIVRVPFVALASSPLSQLAFGCISATVSFIVAMVIQELLKPGYRESRDLRPGYQVKNIRAMLFAWNLGRESRVAGTHGGDRDEA